VIDPIL
jgi:hypothetical protein